MPSRSTEYRGWYASAAWRRLRLLVISRDMGLCQECKRKGILTALMPHAPQGSPSTAHVDHKRAHRGDWNLFSDIDNLETLCATCHGIKTASADGGFGHSSAPTQSP